MSVYIMDDDSILIRGEYEVDQTFALSASGASRMVDCIQELKDGGGDPVTPEQLEELRKRLMLPSSLTMPRNKRVDRTLNSTDQEAANVPTTAAGHHKDRPNDAH